MNKEEIYETICMLANSQGLYGRILNAIEEYPEALDYLEEQNFEDPVDMVLFIEQ